MSTDTHQAAPIETSGTSPKDAYEGALTRQEHHPMARHCAEKVLDRLISIRPNSQAAAIARQIGEASAKNDFVQIVELSKKLETLQAQESEHIERLAQLKTEYSFETLLSAFPEDLQHLAYQIANDVLAGVQQALNGGGKANPRRSRTPKAAKSYIIKHGQNQIVAEPNTGRPKALSADRAFFEFMGFSLVEDGKALEPASFVNHEGDEVRMISKKTIIDDLIAGNSLWLDKGYSINEGSVSDIAAEAPQDAGEPSSAERVTEQGTV